MKQELRRLHARVRVKPCLHDSVGQDIGKSEESHALMVRHPTSNQFGGMAPGPILGRSEIGSLVKAIDADPSILVHAPEILQCRCREHVQSEKRGIRGNDQRIHLTVEYRQLRDAECMILIIALCVSLCIGTLRNSPWNALRSGEFLMREYRGVMRAVQKSTGITSHPQCRHQILEHSPSPRN